MKKIIIIFLFILCLSFTSALSLNNTNLEINKTLGVNKTIKIDIENDKTFDFYNVTFEDNDFIKINKINKIESGTSVQVTATIFGDSSIDDVFRIKGYYLNNIGETDDEYFVNVTEYKSDPCSFSVNQGDSITWKNNLLSVINLYKHPENSPVDGGNIIAGENFTLEMDKVGQQGYKFLLGGWPFPEICYIDVLPTTGYINNPEYDAILNLDLNLEYEKTQIESVLINTEFDMYFYDTKEGVLSVKNTGDKKAYDVTLSGDWLSFDKNNFNLESGETKGIVFEVSPYVVNTSQTNKTYEKNIKIEGNFETQKKKVNIFIKHSIIDEDFNESQQSLVDFIKDFCDKNPEICGSSKVIYKNSLGNNTAEFEITEDQWKEYWLNQYEGKEETTTVLNYVKDIVTQMEEDKTSTKAKLTNIENSIQNDQEKDENNTRNVLGLLFFIVATIVVILIIFLIFYYKNKRQGEYKW
ncbi:MAG: hypothetical protein ACOCV1_00170 [Bacillota bacterium]